MSVSRQRVFLVILLSVLLLAIVFRHMLRLSDVLPIQTVKIESTFQYLSQQEVQNVLAPLLDRRGFFSIDLKRTHACLLALPWVEAVTIRRVWPDTLLVTMKESQAVAIWNAQSLLTANAEVSPSRHLPEHLPRLYGPQEKPQQVLHEYQKMSTILQTLGLSITQVVLLADNTWIVVLDDHIQVKLGSQQRYRRLDRLVTIFPSIVNASPQQTISQIDLRYANGVAVRYE